MSFSLGVPVHIYLFVHLHGALALYCPHHWSIRDHQGKLKGLANI